MNDKTEPVVRAAVHDDEEALMDLCCALHKENGLFEMDDGMVRSMLHRAFNRQGAQIGVIDGNGEIAAAIYILISNFWYSRDNHLEELFNFVRPRYRKGKFAKSEYGTVLIEYAKRSSDELKIPLVIGVITNSRTAAKARLYMRKLGSPAGAFFIHGSKWSNQSPSFEWWHRHTQGGARGQNRLKAG